MVKTAISSTGSPGEPGAQGATAGFTLLELLLVLAIAGLVIGLGAPALFGGGAGANHKSAVKSVASGLRNARNEALFTAREATFTFDVEGRSYQVGAKKPVSLPRGVGLVLRTAESETRDSDVGAIRFYPDGSSSGGFVKVAREGAEHDATQISVDWLTGRISVDR